MKIRDLLNKVVNKTNKQTNLSPRKRLLNKLGITTDDILDMKVDNLIRRRLNGNHC